MKIQDVIKKTVIATINELQRREMLKASEIGTFKKTEKVLYLYPHWLASENEDTQKMCELIGRALNTIGDDFYFDIIDLKYFRGWTHEKIAEHFGVDVSVISKQRTKLINKIRPIIFSDEFLKELYEL